MSPFKNYRIVGMLKALTPITHASGTQGNESVIAREQVVLPNGRVARVPKISGNAMRHCMLREPAAAYLIERYRWDGKLDADRQQFLLNGGANCSGGGGAENTGLVVAAYTAIPMVRMLGGTLPSQIIGGSAKVSPGILVCRENQSRLEAMAPDGWWPDDIGTLRPAEDFLSQYQYVRADATDGGRDMVTTDETRYGTGRKMIFGGQSIAPGATFMLDMFFERARDIEIGAVLHAIHLWQAVGGILGGMSAKGHGRMQLSYHLCGDDVAPIETLMAAYVDTVMDREESANRLMDAGFPMPPAKAKAKPTKGKAKPAEVVPDPAEESNEGMLG